MRRRGWRTLAALLGGLVLLLPAACATVPEESAAKVIAQGGGESFSPPMGDVPEPEKDLDALSVVRQFVAASAQQNLDNARARVYLDPDARANWRPDRSLTVMEEKFDTIYAPEQPPGADRDFQRVLLRGRNVGKLGADSAFIPLNQPFERQVNLRRQPDGQWKIVSPQNDLVITETDFSRNFFRAPVYFFAPGTDQLVPDLRYVTAKPQSNLPARVVDLLLRGPSNFLRGAVESPLGDQADVEQNVAGTPDGAVLVALTGVGEQSAEQKQRIAAQIVRSLQSATSSKIRLLSDGVALLPGREDWRASDVPTYETGLTPTVDLPGAVVAGGRVHLLEDGTPVPGPAGSGAYDIVSAAQSADGKQLAVVERRQGAFQLRVGPYGGDLVATVDGISMTRPTWRPTGSGGSAGGAAEVWVAIEKSQVARVARTAGGAWSEFLVNADDVRGVVEGEFTNVRLSRDGTRVALVAGGKLVVASVVRQPDGPVVLREPRVLQENRLVDVKDVDWQTPDTLVAITGTPGLPVVRVPVDGLRLDQFNSSNLTPPMHAITAAAGRNVIVADAGGLWSALEIGEVWRPTGYTPRNAIPFYPG